MRVSFLVPCYNYAQYLQTCIDSILSQTFEDFEVLILDDASTDNTAEIAKALCQKDSRIKYHPNTRNFGHLNNYDRGIALADGELIWLISADDALASNKVLKEYVAAFDNDPNLNVAFCRVQIIDEHGAPQQKWIPRQNYPGLPDAPFVFNGEALFKKLIQANFAASPGVLAKKACYQRHGGFHPLLTHSGDWYNWLLFSLSGNVYYSPEAMVYYRVHSQNMHRTYQQPRIAEENTLACYDVLMDYLKTQNASRSLKWHTTLARAHYKKQAGFKLSPVEKIIRVYGKFLSKV